MTITITYVAEHAVSDVESKNLRMLDQQLFYNKA
jgi:hypothetical protein